MIPKNYHGREQGTEVQTNLPVYMLRENGVPVQERQAFSVADEVNLKARGWERVYVPPAGSPEPTPEPAAVETPEDPARNKAGGNARKGG